jgi:hypothetical protein
VAPGAFVFSLGFWPGGVSFLAAVGWAGSSVLCNGIMSCVLVLRTFGVEDLVGSQLRG